MNSKHFRKSHFVICVVIPAFILLWTSTLTAQDAGAIFTAKCAMCHGKDATGKTPMGLKLKARDLHSPEVQKVPDAEMRLIIAKGKDKMPAYAEKLNKEQIDGLVAYVRGLGKK